jgi:hypothetical protein
MWQQKKLEIFSLVCATLNEANKKEEIKVIRKR